MGTFCPHDQYPMEGVMNMKNFEAGLQRIVTNEQDLKSVIEKVGTKRDFQKAPQGMRVFWETLYCYEGWKLQKNYYFNHCRIVDDHQTLKAWGTEKDMMDAVSALA